MKREEKLYKFNENGELKNKYISIDEMKRIMLLNEKNQKVSFYNASGKLKGKKDFSEINLNKFAYGGTFNLDEIESIIFTIKMNYAVSDIVETGMLGELSKPLFESKTNDLIGIKFNKHEFKRILIMPFKYEIFNHLVTCHSLAFLSKGDDIIAYGIYI